VVFEEQYKWKTVWFQTGFIHFVAIWLNREILYLHLTCMLLIKVGRKSILSPNYKTFNLILDTVNKMCVL